MKGLKIASVLGLAAVLVGACAPPTPVVQVVTQEVIVTQEVEVEVVVTEQVEVPVEVTPTPIGGELILYSCLFPTDKEAVLFETFRQQTGVTNTCLNMGAGEALERIRAEAENPQADILFGTTNLSHVNLAADGLTEPYKGVGWNLLPDGPIKDPDGYWSGFYTGVIAFACNTERLAELGATCPTSWAELADPVFEGELIMPSPAASGTAYTTLTGPLQLYGVDEGFEFWESLDANFGQYAESSGIPGPAVANGEYAVTMLFAHDIQTLQDSGLPLELTFPSEGTSYEIGGISIIQGARNLPAAQAWVDYVFTPAFQRYHNDVAHRIPVVPGVALAEGNFGLEDVVLVDGYNPTDWAAQRDALTARWEEEIGSLRGS